MGLGNTTFHGSHRPTCCLCGGLMPCHRHRSIVSPGYHRESPALSPGLVGWLVDFQASERLEDEIAEPMELASLWCLGFTISEGLFFFMHVMLIHVDVAGRILNDLFESSSNHLRIILMVKLSCLIVWMLKEYPHTSSLRFAASMVFWHCWLELDDRMGCSEPFVQTSFPSSNFFRNPQKAGRNCHGFIDVSCLVSCLESHVFFWEKIATGKWKWKTRWLGGSPEPALQRDLASIELQMIVSGVSEVASCRSPPKTPSDFGWLV